MSSRLALSAGIMMILSAAGAGAASADGPTGNWLTQGKNGIVEIFNCAGNALCGRLVWVQANTADNPHARDLRNPVPALRDRPLCGLLIMSGFHPEGGNRWGGGHIYDPESGHTYDAEMELRPDGALALRGYVLVSLFGRTETWSRFAQPVPRCPS